MKAKSVLAYNGRTVIYMTKVIKIVLLSVQSALAEAQQTVPSTFLQKSRGMREALRGRMVEGLGNTACEDRSKEFCLPSLGKKY